MLIIQRFESSTTCIELVKVPWCENQPITFLPALMMMIFPVRLFVAPLLLTSLLAPASSWADAAYEETVWPVLKKYCVECHGPTEHKAEINFHHFQSADAYDADPEVLDQIIWVMEESEMPPAQSPQPSGVERQAVIDWMQARFEAIRNANPGDPGRVVMARLNQSEYDHVIRDFTGYDLQPARYFTSDASSTLGFTNVGSQLGVEPVRIENYLAAAKEVMRHAYVSPTRGLVWHADPVSTADDEEIQQRIMEELAEWHQKREADYMGFEPPASGIQQEEMEHYHLAGYLYLAWQFRHRAELGGPDVTIAELTKAAGEDYLPIVAERWIDLLEQPRGKRPMIDPYLALFDAIPGPSQVEPAKAWQYCQQMEEIFWQCLKPQQWFEARDLPLDSKHFAYQPAYEITRASEPIRGKLEAYLERGFPEWAIDLRERGRYTTEIDLKAFPGEELYLVVTDAWDGNRGDSVRIENAVWEDAAGKRSPVDLPDNGLIEAPHHWKLSIPEGAVTFSATAQLANTDRDTASIQFAVLPFAPQGWEQHYLPGRQLIAWPERRGSRNTRMHHETGLLGWLPKRSDQPVGRRFTAGWIVDDRSFTREELKQLGFGPGDFDGGPYFLSARPLVAAASPAEREARQALIQDLEIYSDPESSRGTFDAAADRILRPALRFLWRRDLPDEAYAHYYDLYLQARADGASFDESVKRPLIVAMMSPQFLFKTRKISSSEPVVPLDPYDLASRLSFFIWASAPDERLLALARTGEIMQPEVLTAEARRMLKDDRARALGQELAGRWLGFHAFDAYTQPDMDKFPEYTVSLRTAMYEEAIQSFLHLFQDDLPLTDLIRADYVYVNEELAGHYNIPGVKGEAIRRVELTPALQQQRGGIFGMGALLTVTSTPLRSSPIYRGVWILDKVLGTPTPEPPPLVPTLSEEEVNHDGIPLHEQLARHREDPGCAVCHNRIDPPGLALEQYDAIGVWRKVNSQGEPVFSRGQLRDGRVLEGIEGVRLFVESNLRDFKTQFARKMLAYALGRDPIVSDQPVIEEMVRAMEANEGRPFAALDVLIRSRPFQYQRTELPAPATSSQPKPLAARPSLP